jgi:hypothetical protein
MENDHIFVMNNLWLVGLEVRAVKSDDFLGATDFSVWPVGNNRKINRALFSDSEQDNHK